MPWLSYYNFIVGQIDRLYIHFLKPLTSVNDLSRKINELYDFQLVFSNGR